MLIDNEKLQDYKAFKISINQSELTDIEIKIGDNLYKLTDKAIAEFKYVGLSNYYILEEILSNTTLEDLIQAGTLVTSPNLQIESYPGPPVFRKPPITHWTEEAAKAMNEAFPDAKSS